MMNFNKIFKPNLHEGESMLRPFLQLIFIKHSLHERAFEMSGQVPAFPPRVFVIEENQEMPTSMTDINNNIQITDIKTSILKPYNLK